MVLEVVMKDGYNGKVVVIKYIDDFNCQDDDNRGIPRISHHRLSTFDPRFLSKSRYRTT